MWCSLPVRVVMEETSGPVLSGCAAVLWLEGAGLVFSSCVFTLWLLLVCTFSHVVSSLGSLHAACAQQLARLQKKRTYPTLSKNGAKGVSATSSSASHLAGGPRHCRSVYGRIDLLDWHNSVTKISVRVRLPAEPCKDSFLPHRCNHFLSFFFWDRPFQKDFTF